MKVLLRIRAIANRATLAAAASAVMLFSSSAVNAGTTYTWNPTALANTNWDNSTATGWNAGGAYPGSGGDLTLSAIENDVANMNSKAYSGTRTISMNGVDAYLSELDIGSTTSNANWTIGGATGSLIFKALSGTAVVKSTNGVGNRSEVITAPVVFASNTDVTITPPAANYGYIGLSGTITGSGNLTIHTPDLGGGERGVFYIGAGVGGDVSGYTGTLNFDSTGTSTTGDRIGLLSSLTAASLANAHQMSVNLTGPTNQGTVGISDIELGALNGNGGQIHPYGGVPIATLAVGFKGNASDSFSGAITGFTNFEKDGAGTQILGGANTYLGTTAVNAGALLVNGTHTGGSPYSVASGATLGGIGSIGGAAVTVDAGGFLAPGVSGIGPFIGPFNVGGATINGTLSVEYQGVAGAGNDSIDLLNVASGLDITSASVNFTGLAGSLDDSALVFAKYGTLSGAAFASVSNLPVGYQINYAYNDGNSSNNIALIPVPEPGASVLTVIGMAGLAFGRKWRRG